MKRLYFLPLALLVLSLTGLAFADRASEIQDLKLEKEKLNSEIQKLNRQIAATDSMLKADDSRYRTLQQRYKADTERRRAEIDSLNAKIKAVAGELQTERNKQARAKNRTDNVAAKRKALRAELAGISKRLESQVAQTVPWELESRLLPKRRSSVTRWRLSTARSPARTANSSMPLFCESGTSGWSTATRTARCSVRWCARSWTGKSHTNGTRN